MGVREASLKPFFREELKGDQQQVFGFPPESAFDAFSKPYLRFWDFPAQDDEVWTYVLLACGWQRLSSLGMCLVFQLLGSVCSGLQKKQLFGSIPWLGELWQFVLCCFFPATLLDADLCHFSQQTFGAMGGRDPKGAIFLWGSKLSPFCGLANVFAPREITWFSSAHHGGPRLL